MNTMIKVFALHQSIRLTCGKISAPVRKHNFSTPHDLYGTCLHAISKITFIYGTALFKLFSKQIIACKTLIHSN